MTLLSNNLWLDKVDAKVLLFMHSIFLPALVVFFLCWIGYDFFQCRVKLAVNKLLIKIIILQIVSLVIYLFLYMVISLFIFLVSEYLYNYYLLAKTLYLVKIILPLSFFVAIILLGETSELKVKNLNAFNFASTLVFSFIKNVLELGCLLLFDISVLSFSGNKSSLVILASFFLLIPFILQKIIKPKNSLKKKNDKVLDTVTDESSINYFLWNYFEKINGSFLVERGYQELLLN